ncbi:MAG: hypothetical protein ACOCZD_00120 [Haloferacaceae archaeon]
MEAESEEDEDDGDSVGSGREVSPPETWIRLSLLSALLLLLLVLWFV